MWKICIEEPFMNCEKIYPIQQKKVKQLLDIIAKNEYVNKIIIFGSSVTDRCHIGSDIDIYVELDKEVKGLIDDAVYFVYDLWTNFMVDNRLLNEIERKGVIVYDRDFINKSKT